MGNWTIFHFKHPFWDKRFSVNFTAVYTEPSDTCNMAGIRLRDVFSIHFALTKELTDVRIGLSYFKRRAKMGEVSEVLNVLQILFDGFSKNFRIELWDGTEIPADGDAEFTLKINYPCSLWHALVPPTDLSMGEAYIYNLIDIKGNIFQVFPVAEKLKEKFKNPSLAAKLGVHLLKLKKYDKECKNAIREKREARLKGKKHSIERDREAISYHYDVSNEFYKLFLDKNLVYSCAYFPTGEEDLDRAQELKLDYICRKLRLKPGEKLLDIGCGWGALVIHAAKHYGVEAIGITLSKNQYEYANEWIKREGLQDRAKVELLDYREVKAPEGGFDKLVSVGMFEHVGEEMLGLYFKKAWELLKPGGIFLNHGIACRWKDCGFRENSFTNKYVFPDGELLAISTTLKHAEQTGFEVRDVESLREHYARTLKFWVKRLEANHDEALKYVDEVTYRIWRLYMAGSSYGFASGRHNLYQTILVKPDNGRSGMPWSRNYLYRDGKF